MRWEYKFVKCDYYELSGDAMAKAFNESGYEGWEAVCSLPMVENVNDYSRHPEKIATIISILFKRPL